MILQVIAFHLLFCTFIWVSVHIFHFRASERWYVARFEVFTAITMKSPFATDGRSVSMSWCRAPSGAHDQMVVNCLTVAVLSCSCALSEERSGLSFVSHSPKYLSICTWIITFYMFQVRECVIYTQAHVSSGTVQQIMPYRLWLKPPWHSRHLKDRTRDRRQV
jgi:hypothetical protein